MPFFTNKGPATLINQDLTDAAEAAKTQTYADADYYIALADTKAEKWNIDDYKSIAASHDTTKENGTTGPKDHSDYYGSVNVQASKLSIVHEPTKYAAMFPAIIDSYSETFKADYDQEELYGRMDPVQKYKNTSRSISVSFTVLGYDEDHAHRNVHALSTLAQFLYPVYDYSSNVTGSLNNATAIRESPLWRVRFANLIQKTNRSNQHYILDGLLVAPTNFSFEPNLEAGFFIVEDTYLFPKEIKISLSFNVIHEETLGWLYDSTTKENGKNILRYKWIGNIDNSSILQDNNNSTIFPWGDYSLGEIGEIETSIVSDAATAKAEIEFTDEDFTEEPTEEEKEFVRQLQQIYAESKKG